ncbi:hypothetical protein AWC18_05810 [Mycolicibacter nonchromogenicus]|uniref:PE-PGRS family protein n=1 Tax=Mycolicibacter nonchromogenicus TaxID=1782 RepID=A0A1X1ZHP4_MYCNO|nr:hypothetical protein [Mycolicibacter nonchromogenicus]ORW22828.1 hypothetical protein AWC18_05810 [Mycolicibacter nonchromogenicus]
MGAAVVGAGAILAAPVVGPSASALAAHSAEITLSSLSWQDVEALTPDGWVIFDSGEAAQAYADEISALTLEYGQTAVQWANWLDPFLSFAGISGVGDWVTDRYDLFTEILTPGWDPLAWVEDYYTEIAADPEVLFGPVADFDLSWLWGLLGISASDGDQLDSLLELASGLAGGLATWELLGIYALVPGVINAVTAGIIDLDDLFPEVGSGLDLIAGLAGDSMLDWITSTEETLSSSLEGAIDILEASPGVQWILDLVGQLTDGLGVELPF